MVNPSVDHFKPSDWTFTDPKGKRETRIPSKDGNEKLGGISNIMSCSPIRIIFLWENFTSAESEANS